MNDLGTILVERLALGGDGPRVVIKDSIDIAGVPTRCGSAVLAGAAPAATSADVVRRLIDGGARIIGKAAMHEFAYGVTGINRQIGTPINPRYPGRIPGGSSSGSAAAVAAGIADIGIGTDTGGSIRVPAACCGVFGLKPSFGRVSRTGVEPAVSTLDCVGPLARDMVGIVRAMAWLDPGFAPVAPPADATLGVVAAEADDEIAAAVADALARSGVRTRPVTLPSLVAAFEAGLTIIAAETFAAVGHHAGHPAIGEDVRARLVAAGRVSADRVAAASAVARRFRSEVDGALDGIDALALPTLPIVPPTIAAAADAAASLRLTALVRPFNLSGHPALTIPLETADGLPAGLQLVGAMGGDPALCALGETMAAALAGAGGGRAG